jgi:hypothetical protein
VNQPDRKRVQNVALTVSGDLINAAYRHPCIRSGTCVTIRTVLLTALAMIAFAVNSIALPDCLGSKSIDAASFSSLSNSANGLCGGVAIGARAWISAF